MEYIPTDKFTRQIDNEINLLKGKMKTMKSLTKYINKKFRTNFPVYRIQYRAEKFLKETYGQPDDDADRFIELARKDTRENGGSFFLRQDANDKLIYFLYVSKAMTDLSKKFLDLVIIDSTYKRNRFNLLIVNVLGVNNLGQNILLAFGLLTNEKKESYDWIMQKLKGVWGGDPLNIICDECPSINGGNDFSHVSHISSNCIEFSKPSN